MSHRKAAAKLAVCTLVAGLALLVALLFATEPGSVAAGGYLDEIQRYDITVEPRDDGSLDMTYQLDWLVLDDSEQGPLEWIKVGVANASVTELQPLSGNISNISYLYDGGDYIRIDLDRSYFAGEQIQIEFSLHQSYLKTFDSAADQYNYFFTPGWFNEIEVKSMNIRWLSQDVLSSDTAGRDGDYLLWSKSLLPGEHYQVKVTYSANTFSTAKTQPVVTRPVETKPVETWHYPTQTEYESSSGGSGFLSGLGAFFMLPVIIILGIISRIFRGGGGSGGYRGGFGSGFFHGGGIKNLKKWFKRCFHCCTFYKDDVAVGNGCGRQAGVSQNTIFGHLFASFDRIAVDIIN